MDRALLWVKCGGICHYCEKQMVFRGAKNFEKQLPDDFTVDHRHPVAKGGKDGRNNLAGCCFKCNSLKKFLTEEAFRKRYKSRMGQKIQENERAEP